MKQEQIKSYADTVSVLETFYEDCFQFWMTVEKVPEPEARRLARKDIAPISKNPYNPKGWTLDSDGKKDFLRQLYKQ